MRSWSGDARLADMYPFVASMASLDFIVIY